MAQRYRLEVSAPKTQTGLAKTWEFTPDTENVISIDLELKKDKHRISFCHAKIYDPKWAIFNSLPDCAFSDVPVKLYLGQPGNATALTNLAFEGKVTEYATGYPGPDTLTIVAHDKTIDMRRQKKYRSFRNLTSLQLAQQVTKEYGFDLEISRGAITPTLKDFAFGAGLSDWAMVARALYADGLEMYTKGSKIVIRQMASTVYPITFQRGGPLNSKLEVKISHVVDGGDKRAGPSMEKVGDVEAILSKFRDEATREKAGDRTHRTPVTGSEMTATGAHSEESGIKNWTNKSAQLRNRKDTATLIVNALPDIGLHHLANLDGWGAKVDGHWTINSIHHMISGQDWSTTILELMRGPSKAADKSAGVSLQKASDLIQ